jgi:gamma-glutamyltranspeptidase/glutathione hydrolase
VSDEFSWNLPYHSQRQPALGDAAVATSQPLATEAGLEMLRRGGTAIDAAIAAAAALTVVEPTTNGIGGDAFAIVHADGAMHGFNGSGRSAAAFDPASVAGMTEFPRQGWLPVTVPGQIGLWEALHARFGRLKFRELFEPAVRHAREGYLVAPLTSGLWKRAIRAHASQPEWLKTFTIDGKAPEPGQRMRLPDHARTLEAIGSGGAEDFYRGEIARRIVDAARAANAPLAAADLATHLDRVGDDWCGTISVPYRDYRLHEIPPNGQGLAALVAMAILARFDLPALDPDCPDATHLRIEATKLGFLVAHREVADASRMRTTVDELLGPAAIDALAARIDPARAGDFHAGVPKPGGTVYLCTADREGRMVSLIQSNYTGWGSGIVIPGTGIAMQNRGACFTLERGHPNAAAAGVRPYHTIIPGFLTRDTSANGSRASKPAVAFGVMGGFMQPQGHVQVACRIIDHRQNPQAALDAPRWQWLEGRRIDLERGWDPATIDALRNRGHEMDMAREPSVAFGRGQAIAVLPAGGYVAASDLRADGHAGVA